MPERCPLCSYPNTRDFHQDSDRTYLRCPACNLIFVNRAALLEPEEEKARYDLHQNHPDDPRYLNFLNQLAEPLLERLDPPPLTGLDFGSGPGPTLSIMLAEQGYQMQIYDPYYAPHRHVLKETYDFVTCSETIEHFYTPHHEWRLLVDLVKPGGWLGIMTLLLSSPDQFPNWYFKNDLTHVSFFSRETFRYLSVQDHLSVEFIGDNVILFHKPQHWEDPHHSNSVFVRKNSHGKA